MSFSRTAGFVAWTETFMGLIRRAHMRSNSRSERLVSVI